MSPARRTVRLRPEFLWWAAAAALLLVLAVRGLELRLPGMARPFWEDEIHHNYAILNARHLRALLWNISTQSQPVLDYALRKVAWFFLFGHQERSLRLPSLGYSLLTVLASAGLAGWYARRRGGSPAVALVYGMVAGWWCLHHPFEIYYAAEARHYTLVTLASLLWFAVACLPLTMPAGALAASSLLLANTHFFAFPLLGWGYLTRILGAARRRQWATGVALAATALAIVVFTIRLNHPAWRHMLDHPPEAPAGPVGDRILAGLGLWWNATRFLALPVPAVVCWAALACAPRRREALPALAYAVGVIPVLLIDLRFRSAYPFFDRYFTPFFGLGFVTLILSLDAVRDAGARWRSRVPARWRRPLVVLATAGAAGWLGVFGDLIRLVPERRALALPPANFSPYFRLYEEIKAEPGPVLIVNAHCWADDIPLLYLTFIGRPCTHGYTVIDSTGCSTPPAAARAVIQDFVRAFPRGLVVLDHKERPRPDPTPPPGAWTGRVRRAADPVSVWLVRGATGPEELRRLALAAGESPSEPLWRAR